MERLTTRLEDGNYIPTMLCTTGRDREVDEIDGCNEYCGLCNEDCSKCAIQKCFNKLAEYEDLEEQGLLFRLPCKVGTSVYMVAQDCGGDTLDCMRGDCECCPYLYSFVEENTFEVYMCDEVGKTVFLTKAEAEQKLKEMESD